MNKLFWSAVIINPALLAVFIYLDLQTWNNVALSLGSLVQTIYRENGTVHFLGWWWPNYTITQVGIGFGYVPNIPAFAYAHDGVSSVNLPLIWFIMTIAVNLSLIWHSETQRVSKQTKGSKTEIISAQKQKTN
jgi:hypothetical protein